MPTVDPSLRDPAGPPGDRLRPMVLDDLAWVLPEHLHHFPENMFGRLGQRFLGVYYRTFLDSEEAVALVVESADGRPVGFLVGIVDTRRHRALVWQRHARGLAGAAALGMLTRPRLAAGLAWARARVHLRQVAAPTAAPRGRIGVLSHVAVSPTQQGRGSGRLLVEDFLHRARDRSSDRIDVATASVDGAGSFYLRLGWTLTGRARTFDGRGIELYGLELGEHGA